MSRSYIARGSRRDWYISRLIVFRRMLRRRVLARSERGRFHIRRLKSRCSRRRGIEYLAALVLHLLNLLFGGGYDVVELFEVFEEVADVEESVAIEPDFDESRLHARQHACDTALVDASN